MNLILKSFCKIVRNLSTSWYHGVPDVSIRGHLPPIKVNLSQPDLKAIMRVLDENLKEGQVEITGEKKEVERSKNFLISRKLTYKLRYMF